MLHFWNTSAQIWATNKTCYQAVNEVNKITPEANDEQTASQQ